MTQFKIVSRSEHDERNMNLGKTIWVSSGKRIFDKNYKKKLLDRFLHFDVSLFFWTNIYQEGESDFLIILKALVKQVNLTLVELFHVKLICPAIIYNG